MLELTGLDLHLIVTILETIEKRLEAESASHYTGAKSPWSNFTVPDRLRLSLLKKKAQYAMMTRPPITEPGTP